MIQFDGLSPFRPCGRDLVEFFNSTGWAFYVKLTPNRPTSGWRVIRAESDSPHWTHLKLLLPKSSVARTPATPAADAIAYTQTTCSTGAMPTPQSSAANTMDKPCSPTWQAFTPTQPHKPGNKN